MKLEPLIQSEVSQKNKYGIRAWTVENSTEEPIYRGGLETQPRRIHSRIQQGKEELGQTERAATR